MQLIYSTVLEETSIRGREESYRDLLHILASEVILYSGLSWGVIVYETGFEKNSAFAITFEIIIY